jgi:RNA polymerase sigma-70 factor (ECF subfamily)
LAFARRSCGDAGAIGAEDVVQETFVRAFRARHQVESAAGARAWLYTIARHVCQRLHRPRAGQPDHFEPLESLDRLLPRPTPEIPDLATSDSSPLDHTRLAEARELVERALERLPEPFRRVLILADVAELTASEVAAVLGLKEATVKTRLHRGRLKLREVLARGLPSRLADPPTHARRICLDLLRAKLDAMDRHVPFPFSDQALCERCQSVLASLDLAGAACISFSQEPLSPRLRERLEALTGPGTLSPSHVSSRARRAVEASGLPRERP